MLTTEQESYLNHFLGAYEVRVSTPALNEVRDHYREAITTAIANGSSFDEALTNTHAAFGRADGILALEAPFQKSLSSQYRKGVAQTLGTLLWGRKLPITVGLFAYICWKNSTASTSSLLFADIAVGFALLQAYHFVPCYTGRRYSWLNWLVSGVFFSGAIGYFMSAKRIIMHLQATDNWALITGLSVLQTLLLLVFWANIWQNRSSDLRRTPILPRMTQVTD
ncbi:hypothetical protein A6C57_05800 [Fibrella sp. ES10-3-2-2]|nr:hypothetical protein A6C57_05800 [Fibrella sp. ES10-3-2-2]